TSWAPALPTSSPNVSPRLPRHKPFMVQTLLGRSRCGRRGSFCHSVRWVKGGEQIMGGTLREEEKEGGARSTGAAAYPGSPEPRGAGAQKKRAPGDQEALASDAGSGAMTGCRLSPRESLVAWLSRSESRHPATAAGGREDL